MNWNKFHDILTTQETQINSIQDIEKEISQRVHRKHQSMPETSQNLLPQKQKTSTIPPAIRKLIIKERRQEKFSPNSRPKGQNDIKQFDKKGLRPIKRFQKFSMGQEN